MRSRRRTRLTVLSAHVIGSGVWLGVLATTLLIPHQPTRPVYVLLAAAAVVAVASGGWLAWGLWRFGWVRAKLTLTALVTATAGVVWGAHLTGRDALTARYIAVGVLLIAMVVAVVKPHRTGKGAHVRETRQVVRRTETDQGDIRAQGGAVMDPRREPALILGLVAAAIQMFSTFVFHLTTDQQGTLNAVAVAVAGLLTALVVRSDQLAPAVLGVLQAIIAVGLAFGLALSPDLQGFIMSVAATLVAAFVRTQVQAPIPSRVTVSPVAA